MSLFNPFQFVAASNQFGLDQQTDAFAIDSSGALTVSWVVGGGNWNGPLRISPPDTFVLNTAVASSKQFGLDHQTDVFAIDKNGALTVTWVVEGGAWSGPVAISPGGAFPAGAPLAASNQFGIDNQTDVFAVDNTGALTVSWVVGGGNWSGPVAISQPGMFPLGAKIAASNQFGTFNQTDVFVIDNTGALNVSWVMGATNWNGPAAISPPGVFPPGGALAASNQFGISNQTDIFAVGNNGALHVSWVTGTWNGPVAISAPGLFPAGAAVTACNQFGIGNQTDVFVIDNNGALNVSWVVGGGNWSGPVPISSPGFFPAGAALTTSNQFGIGNQTDVFAIDNTGTLSVFWVVGGGNWSGPGFIANNSITLRQNIVTGGVDAFGGWVEVTVNKDGNVRFTGKVHDSGFESYDFHIRVVVHGDSPVVLAFQKSGSVEGWLHSGIFDDPRRDFPWDETVLNPLVASTYDALVSNIRMEVYSSDTGDLSGALESIADFAIKWIGGSILVNPLTGLIIFIGVEIGSVVTGAGFVGGARVIGSMLWFAGPWGTLYAVAAEGIAAIGGNERELTDIEYSFANSNVFKGTLPPKGDIVLADTIGGNDRAFTMPRFDGKVVLSMGPEGYNDPINYHLGSWKRGQVFIHELTHAWQIHNTHWELGLLASALASKVCEVGGGNPYDAGTDTTKPFNDFNLEQQAHIVDTWFAGCEKDAAENIIDDIASPWYHYIEGNIRVGQA